MRKLHVVDIPAVLQAEALSTHNRQQHYGTHFLVVLSFVYFCHVCFGLVYVLSPSMSCHGLPPSCVSITWLVCIFTPQCVFVLGNVKHSVFISHRFYLTSDFTKLFCLCMLFLYLDMVPVSHFTCIVLPILFAHHLTHTWVLTWTFSCILDISAFVLIKVFELHLHPSLLAVTETPPLWQVEKMRWLLKK